MPDLRAAEACAIPAPTRLALDPSTVVGPGGTWVSGGHPLVVARLAPPAAALLVAAATGAPLGELGGALGQRLARWLSDRGLAHPVPTPGTGPRPEQVAAVVPLGEADRPLSATLGALLAAGVGEVVVVADGVDPSLALAGVPSGAPVTVVHLHARRGPAGARNAGAQQATGEVVAFCDSDCVPEGAWLDVLLGHLADPSVALAAPRVAHRRDSGPGDGLEHAGRLGCFEGTWAPLDQGPHPALVRRSSRVAWVPGACVVLRRQAFEEVGGFDETLAVGEDVDLCWRLESAGWRLRYEPSSLASHASRTGLGAWLRQRFAYGTSAGPLARRHPSRLGAWVASPVSVATAAWVLGAPRPVAAAAWAFAGLRLVRRARPLMGTADATGLAARQVCRAGLASAEQLARALSAEWAPLLGIALALVTTGVAPRWLRRATRRAVALVVGRHVLQWASRRPALGPLSTVALGLAGELAYGLGVWQGCLAARSAEPLLPRLAKAPRHRPSSLGGPARHRPRRPALPSRSAGQEA